jgi:hypothetical protein
MPKPKYSFGELEWQGETYRRDVLIFPDGEVLSPWRREHGHHLELGDLLEIVQAHPQVLIIGTGANGVMKVSSEVLDALAAQGIDAEVMPTDQAVKRFHDLRKEKKAAAALHLTC